MTRGTPLLTNGLLSVGPRSEKFVKPSSERVEGGVRDSDRVRAFISLRIRDREGPIRYRSRPKGMKKREKT